MAALPGTPCGSVERMTIAHSPRVGAIGLDAEKASLAKNSAVTGFLWAVLGSASDKWGASQFSAVGINLKRFRGLMRSGFATCDQVLWTLICQTKATGR